MNRSIYIYLALVALSSTVVTQIMKDTYGAADKIQEKGPCTGYYEFAQTAGEDVISIERARQIARSAGEDICFDIVKSGTGSGKAFAFFSRPGRGFADTQLIFKDPELCRSVFSWIGGDWNPYFSFPTKTAIWKGKPDYVRLKTQLGIDAESVLLKIESNSEYVRYAKAGLPRQSALSVRNGISIWKGAPAYDACFDFARKGVLRFQLLPGGICIFCGKLTDLSRPSEFDSIDRPIGPKKG